MFTPERIELAFYTAVLPNLPEYTVVRYTNDKLPKRKEIARAPADYPALNLEGVPNAPIAPAYRTFGMMNATTAASMNFTMLAKVTFDIVLITKKDEQTRRNEIMTAIRKSLFAPANFPHLGVTEFSIVGITIGQSRGRDGQNKTHTLRTPITFECRPKRSQVTT